MHLSFTSPADPLGTPLMKDLLREYTERYGPGARREFERHPGERFLTANGGAFLLGLIEGEGDGKDGSEVVAGGAFMRSDDATAEVKRMWTHPAHRRRGYAARILTGLEDEAARRGYERIVLSTGPRQPEAVSLYRRLGYGPLDPAVDPAIVGYFTFVKPLPQPTG